MVMFLKEYRGYRGSAIYDSKDSVYYGKVLNIPDLILYESKYRTQLQWSFEKAVDEYLETLREFEVLHPESY